MKITSLFKADRFVELQQSLGNDVRWDGWKMIFFRPANAAFYNGGVQRNGRFGYETVIDVDHRGFWNVPPRVIA